MHKSLKNIHTNILAFKLKKRRRRKKKKPKSVLMPSKPQWRIVYNSILDATTPGNKSIVQQRQSDDLSIEKQDDCSSFTIGGDSSENEQQNCIGRSIEENVHIGPIGNHINDKKSTSSSIKENIDGQYIGEYPIENESPEQNWNIRSIKENVYQKLIADYQFENKPLNEISTDYSIKVNSGSIDNCDLSIENEPLNQNSTCRSIKEKTGSIDNCAVSFENEPLDQNSTDYSIKENPGRYTLSFKIEQNSTSHSIKENIDRGPCALENEAVEQNFIDRPNNPIVYRGPFGTCNLILKNKCVKPNSIDRSNKENIGPIGDEQLDLIKENKEQIGKYTFENDERVERGYCVDFNLFNSDSVGCSIQENVPQGTITNSINLSIGNGEECIAPDGNDAVCSIKENRSKHEESTLPFGNETILSQMKYADCSINNSQAIGESTLPFGNETILSQMNCPDYSGQAIGESTLPFGNETILSQMNCPDYSGQAIRESTLPFGNEAILSQMNCPGYWIKESGPKYEAIGESMGNDREAMNYVDCENVPFTIDNYTFPAEQNANSSTDENQIITHMEPSRISNDVIDEFIQTFFSNDISIIDLSEINMV